MSDLLQQLKETVSDAFGQGGGSVVGVDISAGSIKVVELSRKSGQAVLETYGELALGPYADSEVGLSAKLPIDKMSEALSDVIREAKVSSRDCGASIPLSASLINVIEVPKVEDKKLENIIPIEARKYIPVPMSEVLLDWHIIPQEDYSYDEEEAQKSEALIVAIHKDSLRQYQEVMEQSNLNVGFYEIEVFSTIRSVLSRGIQPVMIIDFGISSTKVYIVEHGVTRGSHIINKGSQSITTNLSQSLGISIQEAERMKRDLGLNADTKDGEHVRQSASTTVDHIFSKAHQMLLEYQRKHNKPVSEVVLSGGGSLLKGVRDVGERKLDAEVRIADPFRKVRAPAFLSDILEDAGPEFAVAVGAALRRLREKE